MLPAYLTFSDEGISTLSYTPVLNSKGCRKKKKKLRTSVSKKSFFSFTIILILIFLILILKDMVAAVLT